MHTPWLLTVSCASAALAACNSPTPAPTPTTQMDASAPLPPDRINLNCTVPGGLAESVEDCNRRLAMTISGARFFVGPRRACDADRFSARCAPLCDLSTINPEDCVFTGRTGCPYDSSDGYVVMVDVNGRRGAAAVGAGNTCGGVPGIAGTAIWARVSFADLETAAMSAMAPPRDAGVPREDSGLSDRSPVTDTGPTVDRFNRCSVEGEACGPISGDNCTRLMSGALLCTRGCSTDEGCPGGTCRTFCYKRCGGALPPCPTSFQCNIPGGSSVGACIPNP